MLLSNNVMLYYIGTILELKSPTFGFVLPLSFLAPKNAKPELHLNLVH